MNKISHSPLVPQKSFDELSIGEQFPIPSRTITDAHFAAFQVLSGDNHPIHYDREYLKQMGHKDLLAHGFQTLVFTTAGAGLFPHVLGDTLIGFIEQSSTFLHPVYLGDTLYPILEIIDLKKQDTTGVIKLKSSILNQDGKLCLTGEQRYLVRL
jgi:acyl dehydratase